MLDHLNEEAWTELDRAGPSWTELDRVQSCKQRSGVGGRGDRLLSPVSSPSLVTLQFSLRPFKIIDGELLVKITYNNWGIGSICLFGTYKSQAVSNFNEQQCKRLE